MTAVGCARRGSSVHEQEVIIQIMDFLRQRETSRDLYVLSPPSFPHDIPSVFTILSKSNSYKDVNDGKPRRSDKKENCVSAAATVK